MDGGLTMDGIKGWLYAGLRALVQGIWATLLTVPTLGPLLGGLPAEQRDAITLALATALTAAAYGAFVSLVRWLETRNGFTLGARFARGVAKWLMLGLSKYQPVYGTSSPTSVATGIRTENLRSGMTGSATTLPE